MPLRDIFFVNGGFGVFNFWMSLRVFYSLSVFLRVVRGHPLRYIVVEGQY